MRTLLIRPFCSAAAVAIAAAACGDVASLPESAARAGAGTYRDQTSISSETAAVLLSTNRAMINPAALRGLDLSRAVWLAWDGNEYLYQFQYENAYKGLRPAAHNQLRLRTDGWYETQAPVAGARFTAVQFAADGSRVWAQLPLGWAGVSEDPPRYECGDRINPNYSVSLHLPKAGYPAATYNAWIRKSALPGDSTLLTLSKHLLPVDASQLTAGWKLVGEYIGWTHGEGIAPATVTTSGLTFRIGGTRNRGRVNVMAPAIARPAQPSGSTVWGRFGHLATGELDGYRHPYIYLNCSEYPNYSIVGITLP